MTFGHAAPDSGGGCPNDADLGSGRREEGEGAET